MNEIKFNRSLFLFALPYTVLILCIILIVTGVVSPFVACYSVDSSDRLYIQDDGFIKIYDNGSIIGQIDAPTSRDYRFAIENDTIILATPVKVHIMKLDGSEIETYYEPGANTFVKIDSPTKELACDNGDVYSLKGRFLLSRIIKNNQDVVYQIDGFSFTIKLVTYVATPLCIIGFIYLTSFCIKKKYGEHGDG